MTIVESLRHLVASGWFQVLLLFLLPWGPGPAAGIVLARKVGLSIGLDIALYVLSDVITAFVLEPIVQQLRRRGQQSKVGRAILSSVERLGTMTQVAEGPLGPPMSLFVFTFATDFFTASIVSTGLTMARIIAWISIIAGDVLWFLIILLAAIGIASFLSDDRVLFVVTMVLGFALPPLIRRLLGRRPVPTSGPR